MSATFPPLAEVLAFTTKVHGYFDEDEITALYERACEVPRDGCIVEIGVYCGRSASVLMQVARETGAIVCLFDPLVWMGDKAEPQLAELMNKFRDVRNGFFKLSSVDAASTVGSPIDLIHIDGDHQEDGVQRDCENWLPKLKSGGVACFHDYGRKKPDGEDVFPGIRAMVDQYTAGWQDLGVVNTLAMRRKP